jgi:hypothetical protein
MAKSPKPNPVPLEPEGDQAFWRHQNRWLNWNTIPAALLVLSAERFYAGDYVSGGLLGLGSIAGFFYVDRQLRLASYDHAPVAAARDRLRKIAIVMSALILLAWSAVVYDIWIRIRNTPAERPLSASNARVEVEEVVPREYPDGLFCSDIYVANQSNTVARGPYLGLNSAIGPLPSPLTKKALDLKFQHLLLKPIPADDEFVDELLPGAGRGMYASVCMDPKPLTTTPDELKQFSYVVQAILWRDDSMAPHEFGVTEVCGFYVGDPTLSPWHLCYGHNHSYLWKRSAKSDQKDSAN